MAATRINKKAAMVGAAAITATAMAAGLTAPAGALTLDATTTGPLFRLADIFGLESVTVPNVPVIGDLTVNFAYAPNDPVILADTINAYPFAGSALLGYKRQPGGIFGSAILAGSGLGAYNSGTAYEALLSSAAGQTLPGYTPLVPPPGSGTNITNLAVLQVNNPGTPNGGLFARFQPLLDVFGVDGVSAGGQSASSAGIALNAATVGLALGYNAMSDFPETINPFSLVNSLLATVLPTNLIGGASLKGTDDTTVIARLAALAAAGTVSTTYGTLVPDDLALLEPLRLPVRLINLISSALGFPLNLPTPIADALQPAAKILVNIGYPDVIAPDELDTCAEKCDDPDPTTHKTYAQLGYSAYDRSYLDSGTYTPFMSVRPLTGQEWLQVPGDVLGALVGGFVNMFNPVAAAAVPASASVSGANSVAPVSVPAPVAARAASALAAPASPASVAALTPHNSTDSRRTAAAASTPRGAAVHQAAGRAEKAASAAAVTPNRTQRSLSN